jgi:predicted transcriptional regulator
MENDKKIQKDYEELKKKSDRTEKFIKMVNDLKLEDKDIPKTEKGLQTKVKELMDKLNKKIEKGK